MENSNFKNSPLHLFKKESCKKNIFRYVKYLYLFFVRVVIIIFPIF